MTKKVKIELAPQEKQKLIEPIEAIFFSKILGMNEVLITDESRLSDFFSFQKERAVRPATTPGEFIFEFRQYIGPYVNLNENYELWNRERKKPENWQLKEVEAKPDISKEEIVEKTQKIFGVDVSYLYDSYIVDILLHIAMNYKKKI